MAKNKLNPDTSIDDLGEFDMSEFAGMDMENDSSRRPIDSVIKTIKTSIVSPDGAKDIVQRLLQNSIPDDYTSAFDSTYNVRSDITRTYDKTIKELNPAINSIKEIVRQNASTVDKILPKSVSAKLLEIANNRDDERSNTQREDPVEAAIRQNIENIFSQYNTSIDNSSTEESPNVTKKKIDLAQQQDRVHKKEFLISSKTQQLAADGIARLVGYQDSILYKYHQKSLELQYRQLFVTRNILEIVKGSSDASVAELKAITKNTSLPDALKIHGNEIFNKMTKEKLIGGVQDSVSGRLGNITKRLGTGLSRQSNEFTSALNGTMSNNSILDGFRDSGMDTTTMVSDLVADGAKDSFATFWGKKAGSKISENRFVESGGNRVKLASSNINRELNSLMQDNQSGSGFMGWLAGLIGSERASSDTVNHNLLQTATDVTGFDVLSRRSLIEIIPGFLSRQLQQLTAIATGKNAGRVVYDAASEKFMSQDQLVRETKDKYEEKVDVKKISKSVKEIIKIIDPELKLPQEARAVLSANIFENSLSGRSFNLRDYLNKTTIQGTNISEHFKQRFDTTMDDEGIAKVNRGSNSDIDNAIRDITEEFNSLSGNIKSMDDMINNFNKVGDKETLRLAGIIKNENGVDSINKDNVKRLKNKALIGFEGPEIDTLPSSSKQGASTANVKTEVLLEEIKSALSGITTPTVNTNVTVDFTGVISAIDKSSTDVVSKLDEGTLVTIARLDLVNNSIKSQTQILQDALVEIWVSADKASNIKPGVIKRTRIERTTSGNTDKLADVFKVQTDLSNDLLFENADLLEKIYLLLKNRKGGSGNDVSSKIITELSELSKVIKSSYEELLNSDIVKKGKKFKDDKQQELSELYDRVNDSDIVKRSNRFKDGRKDDLEAILEYIKSIDKESAERKLKATSRLGRRKVKKLYGEVSDLTIEDVKGKTSDIISSARNKSAEVLNEANAIRGGTFQFLKRNGKELNVAAINKLRNKLGEEKWDKLINSKSFQTSKEGIMWADAIASGTVEFAFRNGKQVITDFQNKDWTDEKEKLNNGKKKIRSFADAGVKKIKGNKQYDMFGSDLSIVNNSKRKATEIIDSGLDTFNKAHISDLFVKQDDLFGGDTGIKGLKNSKLYNKGRDKVTSAVDSVRDLYVNGNPLRPILESAKLIVGDYYDRISGKRIYSFKDIKGEVVDINRRLVISYSDFMRGFKDENGKVVYTPFKSVYSKIQTLFGTKFDPNGKVAKAKIDVSARIKSLKIPELVSNAIDSGLNITKDIFSANNLHKPKLYRKIVEEGGYIDELTGKVIKCYNDITGQVKSTDGTIVLSIDDIQEGLVDSSNSPIPGVLQRLRELVWSGNKFQAKAIFKAGKWILPNPSQIGMIGFKTLTAPIQIVSWLLSKSKQPIDVYRKHNRVTPVLYAEKMKKGEYRDRASQEIIHCIKDIGGPVEDVLTGQLVLTEEMLREGLYDAGGSNLSSLMGKAFRFLKPLWAAQTRAIWAIAKLPFQTVKYGLNLLTPIFDIYVKGEMDKPRLYKLKMERGRYYDAKTGKPIRNYKDIGGAVADETGNVVLTEEDFEKGLVDKKGTSLRTKKWIRRLNLVYKTVTAPIRLPIKAAVAITKYVGKTALDIGKWGVGGIGKAVGLDVGKISASAGKMSKQMAGKLGFGKTPEQPDVTPSLLNQGNQLQIENNQLQLIAADRIVAAIKELIPKKVRENSWQDKKLKMLNASKAVKESKPAKAAGSAMAKVGAVAESFLTSKLGLGAAGVAAAGAAGWFGGKLLNSVLPEGVKTAIGDGIGAVKDVFVSDENAPVGKVSGGQKSIMTGVYKAFIKAGFSDKQAKALTAEVGRENDYNPKVVFGTHSDAANGATNVGFLSWQLDRGEKLKQRLQQRGLLQSGRMVQSQAALDEMAMFAKEELDSGKYKGVGDFMQNKNISSNDAAQKLGKGYVKWAYGQNVLKNGRSFDWHAADNKRASYYMTLNGIVGQGDKTSVASGQPPMPSTDVSKPNVPNIMPNTGNKPASGKEWNGPLVIRKNSDGMLETKQASLPTPTKTFGNVVPFAGTEKLSDYSVTKLATGMLSLPAKGKITSPFGPRWGKFHRGIDIANATGTPIYAASAGEIIKAGVGTGYGNVIYLKHYDGRSTRYAHLSAFKCNVGDKVKAGAIIGLMGNSGHSTGPHLHFEYRDNNGPAMTNMCTPLDPAKYLSKSIGQEIGAQTKLLDDEAKGSGKSSVDDTGDTYPVNGPTKQAAARNAVPATNGSKTPIPAVSRDNSLSPMVTPAVNGQGAVKISPAQNDNIGSDNKAHVDIAEKAAGQRDAMVSKLDSILQAILKQNSPANQTTPAPVKQASNSKPESQPVKPAPVQASQPVDIRPREQTKRVTPVIDNSRTRAAGN